jgi:hypothetical protein
MGFQLSPGVQTQEIDLTTIVPAVGTTEGAFAGHFTWGPVDEIITIANEVDLVTRFGEPDINTFVSFFTCANFLAYARNLKVVRANSGSVNATANGVPKLVKNYEYYQENILSANNIDAGTWIAKYPGDLGNSLKVSLFGSSNTTKFTAWAYSSYFDGAPNTSFYAARTLSSNDELHVVVVDEDGRFTGTANTVVERWAYLSKAPDAIDDTGSSLYYPSVINDRSQYIWWGRHPDYSNTTSYANAWGNPATSAINYAQLGQGAFSAGSETVSLSNGAFALASNAQIITGFQKFRNEDEVDISLVLTGGHSSTVVIDIISNLVEARQDCIAFISPERLAVVQQSGSEQTNSIAYRNRFTSTSYGVMDSGWKYQFDKYNNTFRYVPLNGDIAGLCVRTDFERDPWYSPAGYNRGGIKNVIKLAWNPNKTQRDELYKNGINPVVFFPGDGPMLFGDKTMLSKPSAFDRINVRRLFIVLRKAIARAAKYSLFEFNDAFTRAQFVNLVEPFLRDVQGRRGIFDFRVVCDETNNTPEVIDRNEFIGDIYIKPARSINFITLRFIAVRTGVAFEEVVGKFG